MPPAPVDLVTGATGFIGRRLVARLVADGRRVRALVLPSEDPRAIPELAALGDRLEVARGDLTDAASIAAAARGVARVHHLAAAVGDWGPEARFEALNVGGTRHVLAAAAAAGCERVVAVSSIVVYGSQLRTGPTDEDAPRERGVGPYGRTKRAAEELALDAHAFGRVPVTIVRPGNVFGPGSALWVDEVVRLLRAGLALVLDGGDGDAQLAYVDDVADVIARAAATPAAAGRIYNATLAAAPSWRVYFTDLARLAGAPPPRRSVPWQVADALAIAAERTWRALRRPGRPLVTREAVQLLASRPPVPCQRARDDLGHVPIGYDAAMAEVARYLAEPRRPA